MMRARRLKRQIATWVKLSSARPLSSEFSAQFRAQATQATLIISSVTRWWVNKLTATRSIVIHRWASLKAEVKSRRSTFKAARSTSISRAIINWSLRCSIWGSRYSPTWEIIIYRSPFRPLSPRQVTTRGNRLRALSVIWYRAMYSLMSAKQDAGQQVAHKRRVYSCRSSLSVTNNKVEWRR